MAPNFNKLYRILIVCVLSVASIGLHAAEYPVTITADSGVGSLREAIGLANGNPGSTIKFAIGTGPQTITLTSNLPSITAAGTIIEGNSQPGWTADDPQIVIDAGGNTYGLFIDANNCEVRNLVINNASLFLLYIASGRSNNKVLGCFLGTNQAGTARVGTSTYGITAVNAPNTTIGSATQGNLISKGSGGAAIRIAGAGTNNSVIQGNRIGTNKTKTASLGNGIGIELESSGGTLQTITIGGSDTGQGNVIAGNSTGILATSVSNIFMFGNLIGTGDGTIARPNTAAGINLNSSSDCTIGGLNSGERNIICSNGTQGIYAVGGGSHIIRGNYIGTGINGTEELGNSGTGITLLSSSPNNTISSNVIVKNSVGILAESMGNTIENNFIGTNSDGTATLGNSGNGLTITAVTNTVSGNTIGKNGDIGLAITSTGNTVRGNFIGTNSGRANLGNDKGGITITGSNNMIGGTDPTHYNIVAYNGAYGVSVSGGTLNSILGNSLYSNTYSGIYLVDGGNDMQAAPVVQSVTFTDDDVTIVAQAPAEPVSSSFRLEFFMNDDARIPLVDGETFMGAVEPVASGDVVSPTFTLSSAVAEKYISVTATNLNNTGSTYGNTSMLSRSYATYTVLNTDDAGEGSLRQAILNANDDPGSRIEFEIAGDGVKTIILDSDLPAITANGTIIDGSTQEGWSIDNPVIVIDSNNNNNGLRISNASNCEIKNLVINNALNSLLSISSTTTTPVTGNKVVGCFIGTDQTGTSSPRHSQGITLKLAQNTVIGGAAEGEGNIISGVNTAILMQDQSNGTIVKGNRIGTNKTGTAAIPNDIGIFILGDNVGEDSIQNITIGGATTEERNIISGNTGEGIMAQYLSNSSIQGNIIGVDKNGTASLSNGGTGIHLSDVDSCTIGGENVGEGNIISSNTQGGIYIGNAPNTIIKGNSVGTGITNTEELGNGTDGIYIDGDTTDTLIAHNVIGNNGVSGITVATANNSIENNFIGTNSANILTLGNGGPGLVITGPNNTILGNIIGKNVSSGISIASTGNTVQGNLIGSNSADIKTLGNSGNGISITGSNNMIGGIESDEYNTIAYNGGYGVSVSTGTLNSILGNSLYSNANSGILLADNGNDSQLSPTIESVTSTDTQITVVAKVPAQPAASKFRLEFFVNDEKRDSITDAQSLFGVVESVDSGDTITQIFETSSSLLGKYLSATATNFNNTAGAPGDTSMLSENTTIHAPGTVSSAVEAINTKYY